MTNSHPPLNEYGANFEMRLDLTDLETARDRNEKALENLRTPTKHPKERARDHSHQSKLRKRGIELAGSPGTGKTRPLSVPPAGFISPAAAANIADDPQRDLPAHTEPGAILLREHGL